MPDMTASLDHVFVLMLENRSFDHLFGFSGLSGIDAATGAPTVLEGLSGNESNTVGGRSYPVTRGADYAMPHDPGHEFPNVLDQLCGPGVRYAPPYPPINGSGFADAYGQSGGGNIAEVMNCFDTARQLPVLYALAQEYAICDHWFSSMPGPTWPNRMFVHAGSSGGLDHSPSTADILKWETVDGFRLKNGTIFDALAKKQLKYHMYSGDEFPMVAALKGVTLFDVERIDALVSDLGKTPFPYSYVFIEPSYNVFHDYRNSSSMHPLSDVRDGEALLKTVYEALRGSLELPRFRGHSWKHDKHPRSERWQDANDASLPRSSRLTQFVW
jgi:phospholipase C